MNRSRRRGAPANQPKKRGPANIPEEVRLKIYKCEHKLILLYMYYSQIESEIKILIFYYLKFDNN